MDNLTKELKILLATMFAFRIKAQYYHWNVEGQNFPQYHDLFGVIYTDADKVIDQIAEHIRTLDAYAPGSFSRYSSLSEISDEDLIPSDKEMVAKLYADGSKLLSVLTRVHEESDKLSKRGIVNFIEGLIDYHETLQWKLKSTIK